MTVVQFAAPQQTTPESESQSDVVQEIAEPTSPAEQALALLDLLNARAGRRYKPVDENMRLIHARLKQYGFDDLRSMVVMKCREWRHDDKMRRYLRPATLFNALKCAQYTGELE